MKHNERGFTLIELLTVIGITAILMTLGAAAIRHYWFVRSLDGGANQVVTQLRELQEDARSESSPIVYGAWFNVDSDEWLIVKFDPVSPNTCSVDGTRSFDAGVQIRSASFDPDPISANYCLSAVNRPEAEATEFVYFFASGSSKKGEIVLEQTRLDGRTRTISVSPITGRVEEL